MPEADLRRTPLHDLHLELGAKMVPFAGYAMPVHYTAGILQEHQHTRAAAGLFDVSHMGQVCVRVRGGELARAAAALEALVPVDVLGLAPGRQRYALFTNEAGGVLDDLMISHAGDHLYLVVNAACKDADLAHLSAGLPGCEVQLLEQHALLALQGPVAADVLSRFADGIEAMTFMDSAVLRVDGVECRVSRSGYTGEDGFEISLPAARAGDIARGLLAQPEVEPIGLGARDSLRLEAGLCLYGHELDTTTTPVEAALEWAISRARREGGAREGGFPGAARILAQLRAGAPRRRVGIQPQGRAPVREGAPLCDGEGREVGLVTSGGFGPSAGRPVAMGYVPVTLADAGTALTAQVRGKPVAVAVAALPFVPQRYHRG